MLLVKTKVMESDIHGKGLFADEDIAKGSVIWKYAPGTTQRYKLKKFYDLIEKSEFETAKTLLTYSYVRKGYVYFVKDNTRYINHTEQPNIVFSSNFAEVATRDILKGEELTENYLLSYDTSDFFNLPDLFSANTKEEILELLGLTYA